MQTEKKIASPNGYRPIHSPLTEEGLGNSYHATSEGFKLACAKFGPFSNKTTISSLFTKKELDPVVNVIANMIRNQAPFEEIKVMLTDPKNKISKQIQVEYVSKLTELDMKGRLLVNQDVEPTTPQKRYTHNP